MYLKSGEKLLILPSSHLHGKDCLYYLEECVGLINSENRRIITEEVEFPMIIGNTNVVKISENDKLVWAQRKGRKLYSKFVLNKKTEPTKYFSIIFKRYTSYTYLLLTCYKGKKSEREVSDTFKEKKSVDFWNRHAFVWGSEEVELPVLLKDPYENR